MKKFAKFAVVGLVGIIMLAGSGVMAGITASPAKATEKGKPITVTITKPEGAIFDSANWTGPNGLKGTLYGPDASDGTNPDGVTMVTASEYSVSLKDYVFTVKWKKKGEKPFIIETANITELSANRNSVDAGKGKGGAPEKPAKATLYKHWNVFFNAQRIKKKEKAWIMFIIGMASPNDSTVTGRIIFGKKKNGEEKPYECKKVTVKNNEPYMLNTPPDFRYKTGFCIQSIC